MNTEKPTPPAVVLSTALLDAAAPKRDRQTTEPGGCECHHCGCIFIGGPEHTACAECHAAFTAALNEVDQHVDLKRYDTAPNEVLFNVVMESMVKGRAALANAERVEPKLWLWKNFVDGKQEYWVFDNLYPININDDDPQTLGDPCGYALFKPSRNGRKDTQ